MTNRLILCTVALLAGCSQTADITTAPIITPTLKNPSANQSKIVGYTATAMRAQIAVIDEAERRKAKEAGHHYFPTTQEVVGAKCRMESAEFKVNLTTPSIVQMPTFKGSPSRLYVSCQTTDLQGASY